MNLLHWDTQAVKETLDLAVVKVTRADTLAVEALSDTQVASAA